MLNIYKASAGSGKTYTLTREYITLLLGRRDPDTGRWILNKAPRQAHRHILAITFTNKATDEMTARIISELAVLGRRDVTRPKPSPYLKELCELFSTDEDTLCNLASATLDDLLMDFAYFHVSTIDAFFQTVLRTFAREVEVPDDFELELDNRYTISLGVTEMLNSINYRETADPVRRQRDRWLRDLLRNFMTQNLAEGKGINLFSRRGGIRSTLIETFTNLLDENFKINSSAITAYLSDLNRIAAFEKALVSSDSAEWEKIAEAARRITQYGDFSGINHHVRKTFEKWAADIKSAPGKSGEAAIEDPAKRYAAAYFRAGKIVPELDSLVIDTLVRGREAAMRSDLTAKMKVPVMRMGLLGCLLEFLDRLCKDNNLILLSDTGSILRDIITDDETPFVYERLGYWLDHFLIDEFQDTSRMQWENMRPMLMESLSRNEHDLIIGDEKQCIYRFRNSDPALLGTKVADTIDNTLGEGLTRVSGDRIEENTNWRSSVDVVKFNNSLFRALGHRIGADDVYGSVVQRIDDSRLGNAGYVSLTFVDRKEEGDEAADGPIPRAAIEGMARNVRHMIESGRRMRDIAVLVRTHSEGQQVIDRLLRFNDDPSWAFPQVEITSSDSMEISRSGAVRIIMEVLRLALAPEFIKVEKTDPATGETTKVEQLNPQWRRARLNRWYHYFINLETDPATSLPPAQGDCIAYAVAMVSDPDTLPDDRRRWREDFIASYGRPADDEASTLTAPSLDILVDNIIDRYVSPRVRERDTIFIVAFQDLVADFMEHSASDIRSFVDWWDRSGCRRTLATLPDTDAITVMTIHQSKGLEFPCVIIPNADWDMVTYHSAFKSSYGWYSLDPRHFPGVAPSLVPPMLPMNNEASLLEMPPFAAEAATYRVTQQVDALNVAYVAFTRAVDELVVYAPHDADRPKEKLGDYLYDVFTSPQDDFILNPDQSLRPWLVDIQEIYSSDTRNATLGTPSAVFCKKEEDAAGITGGGDFDPILPPELPSYRPGLNLSMTAITEADLDIFDFDDPRQKGTFIHNILSRISNPSRAAIEVRRAAYRARLSREQAQEIADLVDTALANPQARGWFSGYKKLIVERQLLEPGKITRRPDRIVWTADGHIDIIDYKTGRHDKKYHNQVREYARRMHKAGYTNLRGYLWYVTDNYIEPVPLRL